MARLEPRLPLHACPAPSEPRPTALQGALTNLNEALCGGTPGGLGWVCFGKWVKNRPAAAALLANRCNERPCAWLHATPPPPAETNSLYWPWYCDNNAFWQHLLKALLTGVLPSILSTMWDT